jgi:hypothetical protein
MLNGFFDPNFGQLDFDLNTSDDRPTWPPPGSAHLVVEDKYEPLFTSATWTIRATVNGQIISESTTATKAHSDAFLKRWTRQMIRTNYERLRQLGVDADSEYVKWGGLPDDFLP